MSVVNLKKVLEENSKFKKTFSIDNTDIEKEEVTVFLSYDISDSTHKKIVYHKEWTKIIEILLNAQKDFQIMDFWKFNGDEVLFKCNVSSVDFICKLIERAFSQLESMQDLMQDKINNITLKGTMWIAMTSGNLSKYPMNYRFMIKENIDYFGKNIDEGFRLTKWSSMKKIAIDPKIVYILLDGLHKLKGKRSLSTEERDLEREINNILQKIHFIGDVFCKGIWNNYPYPVYWYYEVDALSDIRYGEYLNGVHIWRNKPSPIIANYAEEKQKIFDMFMEVDVKNDVVKLIKKLNGYGVSNRTATGKANLYFMVVCINPNTGSVLIAQRSSKRKHLKGVWDFGNVKYQKIAMEEIIKSKYKSTFGIDIELIKDKDRDNSLKPYSYCTIYRNKMPHNGIMFYATIQTENKMSDEELSSHINETIKSNGFRNYQAVEFVSLEMVNESKFEFNELTLEDIRLDSQEAPNNKDYTSLNPRIGIMHFKASIKDAIKEWRLNNNEDVKE